MGAAAAAAGRLLSTTTREYDELVKAFGGQRTLLDKNRGGSSETEGDLQPSKHGWSAIGGDPSDLRHELN